MEINYANVDRVIELFKSYEPYGSNFYDATSDFLEYREKDAVLKFLLSEGILEQWGAAGKHIITDKGIEITSDSGGIKGYLDRKKKEKEYNSQLDRIRDEKLKHDAKLAKYKVKTFWYLLASSIISLGLSFFNFFNPDSSGPTEQEIQQIVKSELLKQQKTDSTSASLINKDSSAMREPDAR